MANVYTRQFRRPRTTTLRDFGAKPSPPTTEMTTLRVLSPTRRCNPQPMGLVYQSPYNREGKTFEIWHPDFSKIYRRFPSMLKHLDMTNFTSGPAHQFLKRNVPSALPDIATTTRAVQPCKNGH
ncbi:PREDICTED: uncharacterized protein LOC106805434 isoform X2 [Priapulus caudatus]|uniref:Uncharacterized protein LOC106805434 isoform X2 n=1 Tax=Priapulus caudatus TaxID=37621 RepID=A0ABM1DRD0_PRICU|nr:PREDICTED: uncharacterized protein LOC106805434 isoform X2 [Priapulus caudatus]